MKKLKYILLSTLMALPLFAVPALAAGDTTPPTVPTNLAASLNVSNQPSLTWTASTDNVGVVGYVVLRDNGLVGVTSATNFVDVTTATSTTYAYTVIAYDAANNFSVASSPASITTGSMATTSDTTPPTAPTNLIASLNSSGQVSLVWTASTDNVGVMGYTIMRDNSSVGTSATPSFLDMSIASNTTYVYTVTAFDAAGNVSGVSNSVSVTTTTVTTTGDTTPPSAPTNLAATLNGSNQVSLTWATTTDNVGVLGYSIMRDNSSIGTSATPNFLDTSVASNTTYVYTVTAFDAAGNVSGVSNSVSIMTSTGGTGGNGGNGNPGDKNENENEHGSESKNNNDNENGNHSGGEHHNSTAPETSGHAHSSEHSQGQHQGD